jgi:CubicO group peptidase (beta-lactamase class C family)|tara:strand:- start:2028 stop:3197 length:1170 start_codon:yes stop_codon:yes gene_type:complete
MEINGHCDEKFSSVLEAFEDNFQNHDEVGASFAATVEGEMVVDIWAGHLEREKNNVWNEDTIVSTASITKTMAAISALILADRGELDLDAPVMNYWPEFGVKGKEHVLVKHFLCHSAGLPGLSKQYKLKEMTDWDLMCSDLANQELWWNAGEKCGYHTMTSGFLIGEVIRRVSGKTVGDYFNDEVSSKLDADFYIGTPEEHHHRVGNMIPPNAGDMESIEELNHHLDFTPGSVNMRVMENYDFEEDHQAIMATPEWWKAEIPAGNGMGNARGVVRAQTAIANQGKAFGVQLISNEICKRANEVQISGIDELIGIPMTYCMGYAQRDEPFSVFGDPKTTIHWGGNGGSSVIIDMEAHLCFSYVMNRMSGQMLGDKRADNLGYALYAGLKD